MPAGTTGYDAAGRLRERTLGSGLTQKFIYYPWDTQGGRLKGIVAGSGTWNATTATFSNTIQKLDYEYDGVGNITTITDTTMNAGQKQCFLYDAMNRLKRAGTYATGTSDPLYALGCTNTAPLGVGNYHEGYSYDGDSGNLASKAGLTLEYTDASHDHAVTGYNSNSYFYDANGNMTKRVIGGQTYNLHYDAENRLSSVTQGSTTMASFVYDGDGHRVQSTVGGVTTSFVGNYYEVTGSTVTKYYYAGGQRIAMRVGSSVYYLLSDQLGSTSVTALGDGTKVSELRYKAWGEVRLPTDGHNPGPSAYTCTGQYSQMDDFGLMFYNARWYDPALGRFAQADTVVPDDVQGYDRYAYANNNPVLYNDPSGHCAADDPACWDKNSPPVGGGGGNQNRVKDPPRVTWSYFMQLTGVNGWQTCQATIGASNPLCTPNAWITIQNGLRSGLYSTQSMMEILTDPKMLATAMDATSQGLGFADAMHWVHAPVVGVIIDTGVQLGDDSGGGYTFWQETSRVVIHVTEGQVSSGAGMLLAGVDSVPGAVTGPGDVAIIGGSYIVGNAATSFSLNQLNGAVVDQWPGTRDYIPYEPIPDYLINK